jgi:hypothetical protein
MLRRVAAMFFIVLRAAPPWSFLATKARTCAGRISPRVMAPNVGSRWAVMICS